MRFNLFNFVLVLLLPVAGHALERFSAKSCLDAHYKSIIAHRGPLFGLLSHELVVEKRNCVITVKHRRYLPKEWVVDVCREPVHIKTTSAIGVDVDKKEGSCVKADNSRETTGFCKNYYAMMDAIQDYGLIFAEGDRDSLSTPHGKTYCAYLLMERYLKDSMMLSRYTEVPDIFAGAPAAKKTPPAETAPVGAPATEAPTAPQD
jgi:hypothetical protein